MTKAQSLILVLWILAALMLTLISCGGREGDSPASPFLAAGDAHTVAIKKDGTLWAWGWNSCGQLGKGTNIDSNTPVQVGSDNDWQSVSAGQCYTIAIKKGGTLWAWGLNQDGQLGTGTNTNSRTPVRVGVTQ